MTDSPLTVFCLVDGEARCQAFSVDIDASKTVDHLKKLIKAEKTNNFSDADADQLNLWRVSVAITDDDDELPILLDSVNKKKLGPATRISKVFTEELPEETIQIIVKRPPEGNVNTHCSH